MPVDIHSALARTLFYSSASPNGKIVRMDQTDAPRSAPARGLRRLLEIDKPFPDLTEEELAAQVQRDYKLELHGQRRRRHLLPLRRRVHHLIHDPSALSEQAHDGAHCLRHSGRHRAERVVPAAAFHRQCDRTAVAQEAGRRQCGAVHRATADPADAARSDSRRTRCPRWRPGCCSFSTPGTHSARAWSRWRGKT